MPIERRGTYPRDPITCQYCGVVCKGKAAMAKHINSKHQDEDNVMVSNLARCAGDKNKLGVMLRSVAEWTEGAGDIELPKEFISELKRQGIKAQLSLVLCSFDAILDIVNLFDDLRISEKVRRPYMTESEIRKTYDSNDKILRLQKQLKQRLHSDIDVIMRIHNLGQKGEGNDANVLVTKLVDLIGEMQRSLMGGNGKVTDLSGMSASELIPDKPSEREALRRELDRRNPNLSRLVE